MRVCEAVECQRTHYAHGLCFMHYQRCWRHGAAKEPERIPVRLLPEVAKMLNRRRVTETGCWEWTGGTNGVGYGVITIRYRRLYVHRLAYSLTAGPIPAGMVIDHLCRNRACFNPEHLEAVSQAENIRRSPLVGPKSHCIHGHVFAARTPM